METLNIKQCTSCKEHLPIKDFYTGKYGINSYCKPCYIEYQSEYRRKKAQGYRPSRRPLFLINRERLSLGGTYRTRSTTDHRPMALHMTSYGYILDKILVHCTYDIEDILLYLHDKKVKVLEKNSVDETIEILAVRNSCGVPIDVEVLISLVSLDQYYLWMDSPRPFTTTETAHHLKLPLKTVEFILSSRNRKGTVKSPYSPGEQNSEQQVPQHIDITSDDTVVFVEE